MRIPYFWRFSAFSLSLSLWTPGSVALVIFSSCEATENFPPWGKVGVEKVFLGIREKPIFLFGPQLTPRGEMFGGFVVGTAHANNHGRRGNREYEEIRNRHVRGNCQSKPMRKMVPFGMQWISFGPPEISQRPKDPADILGDLGAEYEAFW